MNEEHVEDLAVEDASHASSEPKETKERTFTQAEVDALMGKVRREVKGQFSDYDELKAKADKAAEQEAAAETERARAEKAEAERDQIAADNARMKLFADVSQKTGVPVDLLHGETEEELTNSASAILAFAQNNRVAYPADKGGATPGGAPVTDTTIDSIKDPIERIRMRSKHLNLYK